MSFDEGHLEREIEKLMQSRSFLVKGKPKDQVIFDTACSFHSAGLRCSAEVPNDDGTYEAPTSPAIACYAFACELYIKALLETEGGRAKGHNLRLLFGRLSAEVQGVVFNGYQSLLPDRTRAIFAADLAQFANAFLDWRYIYEQTKIAIYLHRLVALTWSLHSSVRVLKPSWAVKPAQSARLMEKPNLSVFQIVSLGDGRTMKFKLK